MLGITERLEVDERKKLDAVSVSAAAASGDVCSARDVRAYPNAIASADTSTNADAGASSTSQLFAGLVGGAAVAGAEARPGQQAQGTPHGIAVRHCRTRRRHLWIFLPHAPLVLHTLVRSLSASV